MKVLCYGDSNTWGFDREHNCRIQQRWTKVLQSLCAKDEFIEAGLYGRRTSFDDPYNEHRNGRKTLPVLLKQHQPLDMLIIMLGTNDLKNVFHASEFAIAKGIRELIRITRNPYLYEFDYKPPKILVVVPAPIHPDYKENESIMADFGDRGYEISLKLKDTYKDITEEYQCEYLNAGDFICAHNFDCVHISEESHIILAQKIKEKIEEIRIQEGL